MRRRRTDGGLPALRASYSDEVENRFVRQYRDIVPYGSSADYHLRTEWDYYRLMEIARAIARKDDVVGQAIRRLVANVIQQGPVLNPMTGDDELDQRLIAMWDAWSNDADQCDVSRQTDLLGMAYQTMEAGIVDGDIWTLLTRDGRVQLIEAHRVRSPQGAQPNTFLGVRMSALREQEAIWVTVEALNPMERIGNQERVVVYPVRTQDGSRQVLHFALHRRPGQTRGVTSLAPVLGTVTQHGDLQFAQLVKAQTAAAWTILHQYEPGVEVPAADATMGESETLSYAGGGSNAVTELGPGMEYYGVPGETLTGFSPNIPNQEFFEHTRLILTFIAINLDMPVHVLLMDPSDTNFSGWRGAIEQAQRSWADKQRRLIQQFYTPIYQWKVREWARELGAETNPNLLRHEFNPPFWAYIEPHKDAQGDALIVEKRLNSRRKLLARRGLDIEEVDSENVRDQARLFNLAMLAAQQLNATHPWADLDWRELLTGPAQPLVGGNLESDAEQAPDDEDDDEN